MKPYYYLKADTNLCVGEVINAAFDTFKRLDVTEYKGTAMNFVTSNSPGNILDRLMWLDRPSEYQVRVGVADTLTSFCDEQGYVLRQLKNTKRGACISFWITKRCN